MQRRCGRCGTTFTAKTSRATYCSAACRVANSRDRKKAAKESKKKRKARAKPVEKPVVDPASGRAGSLVESVRRRVRGSTSDPLAQIAIALAQRIEDSEKDSGSGVAALSRELRSTLAAHAARVPAQPSEPDKPAETGTVKSRGVGGNVAQFRQRRAGSQDA